ncbi:MAG TPA: hypothetical protein VHA74_00585 [Candidatus Dojkabacteria bacterium]|nr:hypothetical protein [Candidatus Dojkabacteria bacterium]
MSEAALPPITGREPKKRSEKENDGNRSNARIYIAGLLLVVGIAAAYVLVKNNEKSNPNNGDLGGDDNNPGLTIPATDIPTQEPLTPTENPFSTPTPGIDLTPTDSDPIPEANPYDWKNLISGKHGKYNLDPLWDTQRTEVIECGTENFVFPEIPDSQKYFVLAPDGTAYVWPYGDLARDLCKVPGTKLVLVKDSPDGYDNFFLGINVFSIVNKLIDSGDIKNPDATKPDKIKFEWPNWPDEAVPYTGEEVPQGALRVRIEYWDPNTPLPTYYFIGGKGTEVIASSETPLTPEEMKALIEKGIREHSQQGNLWGINMFRSEAELKQVLKWYAEHPQ